MRRGVDLAKRRHPLRRPRTRASAWRIVMGITAAVAHWEISARAAAGGQSTALSRGRWPQAATDSVMEPQPAIGLYST